MFQWYPSDELWLIYCAWLKPLQWGTVLFLSHPLKRLVLWSMPHYSQSSKRLLKWTVVCKSFPWRLKNSSFHGRVELAISLPLDFRTLVLALGAPWGDTLFWYFNLRQVAGLEVLSNKCQACTEVAEEPSEKHFRSDTIDSIGHTWSYLLAACQGSCRNHIELQLQTTKDSSWRVAKTSANICL